MCSFDGFLYRFSPTVSSASDLPAPTALELFPAFPQPAARGLHDSVSLRFSLPEAAPARLLLYDRLGREIRVLGDAVYSAGSHRVNVALDALPAGIYFYSLHTGAGRHTRKLVLLD